MKKSAIRHFRSQVLNVRKQKRTFEGKGERNRKPPNNEERRKSTMRKIAQKIDLAVIGLKNKLMGKAEASDQLIVMFIIIAVAAGIAGLLYIFAKGTLLPNFQNKIINLIDQWFNHA